MAGKLELGLDDIIKQNKKGKTGGNRGRGGSGGFRRGGNKGRGGPGGARGGGIKRLNSQSPMKNRSLGGGKWQHDKANGGAVSSAPAGPARLAIANLDFGVNDQDINELFSRCGHIVKASVHYDANGRSQGTADVVYRSHKEALAAVNEYNGRLLDGRAMSVQVVGGAPKPSLASRIGGSVGPKRGGSGGFNRNRRGGGGGNAGGARGGAAGGQRGRGGRRGGRGGRTAGPPLSKDDLDKQMEEYRMQTDAA